MKRDPKLRAVVRALKQANRDPSDENIEKLRALVAAYRFPAHDLDLDAARAELLDFRHAVSPEIRYALALHIDGKLQGKRGVKPGALTPVTLAAMAVRYAVENGATKRAAIKRIAAAWRDAGVTEAALQSVIFPRRRRRKLGND